jgi:hypothetical protein
MPDGRKPGKPALVENETGLSQLPDLVLRIIFSENRVPLFGIMLWRITKR